MKSETDKAQLHRLYEAEILLIRACQHLFMEWRDKGRSDKDLEASFEKILELKRDLRERKRDIVTKIAPGASPEVLD